MVSHVSKSGRTWDTGSELDELGVEGDLGVVGEELGDGAASLGIAGGFVERFLGGVGHAGGGGEGDLGHGETGVGFGESDGCLCFDLGGCEAGFAELRANIDALRGELARSVRWLTGLLITLTIAVLGILAKMAGAI